MQGRGSSMRSIGRIRSRTVCRLWAVQLPQISSFVSQRNSPKAINSNDLKGQMFIVQLDCRIPSNSWTYRYGTRTICRFSLDLTRTWIYHIYVRLLKHTAKRKTCSAAFATWWCQCWTVGKLSAVSDGKWNHRCFCSETISGLEKGCYKVRRLNLRRSQTDTTW